MRSRKTKGTQFCLHLFIVCFVVVGGASIVASEDHPGRLIPFLFFPFELFLSIHQVGPGE